MDYFEKVCANLRLEGKCNPPREALSAVDAVVRCQAGHETRDVKRWGEPCRDCSIAELRRVIDDTLTNVVALMNLTDPADSGVSGILDHMADQLGKSLDTIGI